jgi:hypothetical protein
MALTGDRYVGSFEGHGIELVRNNWVKTLSLWIDGKEVASRMCIWPWDTTLNGELQHDGRRVSVVARSVPRQFFFTTDSIEVDGQALSLTKTK